MPVLTRQSDSTIVHNILNHNTTTIRDVNSQSVLIMYTYISDECVTD